MRYGLTPVTAPPVEPLTRAQAKAHLGLVDSGSPPTHADDDLVDAIIGAAREHIEGRRGWLGRALVEQTWDMVLDRFPACEIAVPLPPLLSVTSVKYYDGANALQTLSASLYQVDATREPGRIMPVFGEIWPVTYERFDAVTIRFVCGYAAVGSPPSDYLANIPKPIVAAMKLIIADLYEVREAKIVGFTVADNPAVMALLTPYRVWAF